MPIDNPEKVDGLGMDKATGEAVLLIADHLDWSDLDVHADLLTQKIEAYLNFIRSGQLMRVLPEAEGQPVKIALYHQHEPSSRGKQLLENAKAQLAELGITLAYGALPRGY